MVRISRRLFAVLASGAFTGLVCGQTAQPGALFQSQQSSGKTPDQLGGKSLKEWIKEISSPDPSKRENAIRTVVLFGPFAAREALPALLERIDRDTDTSPRVNAIMALGAIEFTFEDEKDVQKVVDALRKRVTTSGESQNIIRFQAALILGRFGERARRATGELITATQDRGSWEIRKAAVFSLARTVYDVKDSVDSHAIDALVARLFSSNESSFQVRLEATMALGIIGVLKAQDKAKVVSALKRAESDPDKMIAIWARAGLMAHNNEVNEKDMAILVGLLKSKELPVRAHAARAIGTIASVGNPGPPINKTIGPLIEMLDDKEQIAEIAAIWALGRIGPPAKDALKTLSIKQQDKEVTEEGKKFIKEAMDSIHGKRK
jgi:HEAT repeat protein